MSYGTMTCYACGGEAPETRIDYILKTKKGLVKVTGVPAHVCKRCGETTFPGEVVDRLDEIQDQIEAGTVQPETEQIGALAYS